MSDEMFLPRSWEGTILRLSKITDGGAEAQVWSAESRSWEPFDRADKVMLSPLATDAELRMVGLKTDDDT